MKKIIKNLRELFNIVYFSFQVSWKASKKYLILRVLIELILAIIPFGLIVIGKDIINFFVSLAVENYDPKEQIVIFAKIVLQSVTLHIINRFLTRLKDYYGGVHKDIISKDINLQMAEQSTNLDLSFFDSSRFYNELTNAKRDSGSLQILTWLSIDIIRTIAQFLISLFILLELNSIIALTLIALGIPATISEKKLREIVYGWQKSHVAEERKMDYILRIMTERVFAKDVRLYSLENEMLSRYNNLWSKWFIEKRHLTFKKSMPTVILSILPEIGTASMIIYIGINIIYRNLTVGDYSLYMGICGQLTVGLYMLTNLISNIYENKIRLKNYLEFLKWESNIGECGTKKATLPILISFKNVSFKYPDTDNYILNKVSFSLNSNEKIALVGLNGAGKSTIIKLILRFYDPQFV